MSKNILVIGERCLDQWVIGFCPKLSPEGPVPCFTPTSEKSNVGMAANVMANIKSLAPDWNIHFLCPDTVIRKIRYIDEQSGQQIMRMDIGDNEIRPLEYATFLEKMKGQDVKYHAIVFSEYGKGFLSTDIMAEITVWAKEREIPVFCDTKQLVGDWANDIFVIKINRKEADAHKQEPWPYSENVIITEGPKGCYLRRRKNPSQTERVLVEPVEIRSVAGAGDSFLSGLVVSYLEQGDLIEAMKFANKVARVAVSKPGVVAVKREEVL